MSENPVSSLELTKTIMLDGKKLAEKIISIVKKRVEELIKETNKQPCLAVCLVGDDPASKIYVNKKRQMAEATGMKSIVHMLPANISQEELTDIFNSLNQNEDIHGILLQLPLPKHLDSGKLLNSMNPQKDVDGLHPFNLGCLVSNESQLVSCTPFGIMSLLKEYNIKLKGQNALVIGRSRLVGKPIAELLINASATVTVANSNTPENILQELISKSDIVVSAVGKPEFLKGAWIKNNSVIIDVGINRLDSGKIVGDVDFKSCLDKAYAITPVPGGVGPTTVCHLLLNTVRAFEIQCFGKFYTEF